MIVGQNITFGPKMRGVPHFVAGKDFDFAINMDNAIAFDPETEKRIQP